MQGKPREASAQFARALTLLPQLFDQYANICATLVTILPEFGAALRRVMDAWPARPSVEQLFGAAGLNTVANDPLLQCLLQSIPVRDIAFERLLTALRMSLLDLAAGGRTPSDAELIFCCAVAKQCFVNEYVFATTPEEDAQLARLGATLAETPAPQVVPLAVAAVAMYQPLHTLAFAPAWLDRAWPAAIDDVLTQQLREPLREAELKVSIPRLTPIDDDVSQAVRQQYEENPYPRWVHAIADVQLR